MERRTVLAVVAGALGALLLVTVASSGQVQYWHDPPKSSVTTVVTSETNPSVTLAPLEPERVTEGHLPAWLSVIVQVIVGAVLLALIAYGLRAAWLNRPSFHWRRKRNPPIDFEVMPDIAQTVAEDAVRQRRLLNEGTPRNAIVQCWLRLEAIVEAAGFPRDPSDTASEFVEHILGRYSLDTGAINDLANLYREARFSDHEMGEGHRLGAIAALDAIHAGLMSAAAP
jgi:hypothetical protein